MLESVLHYVTSEQSLLTDARAGLAIINKFAACWIVGGSVKLRAQLHNGQTNGATTESPVPQFVDWVLSRVVPLAFIMPTRQRFDYADAQAYQVVGEFCILLKTMMAKRGHDFPTYLQNNVLPTIQCPQDKSAPFLQALVDAPECVRVSLARSDADSPSTLKKFFAPWLQDARQHQSFEEP